MLVVVFLKKNSLNIFFFILVIVLTLYCLSGVALAEEVKGLGLFDVRSLSFYIWAHYYLDPAELGRLDVFYDYLSAEEQEVFRTIIATSPNPNIIVLNGLIKAGYVMEDILHLMQ